MSISITPCLSLSQRLSFDLHLLQSLKAERERLKHQFSTALSAIESEHTFSTSPHAHTHTHTHSSEHSQVNHQTSQRHTSWNEQNDSHLEQQKWNRVTQLKAE